MSARPIDFVTFLKQIKVLDESQLASETLALLHNADDLLTHEVLSDDMVTYYQKAWEEMMQTDLSNADSTVALVIPERMSREYNCIVFKQDDSVHLAMGNPCDYVALQALSGFFSQPLQVYLAESKSISRLIDNFYRKTEEIQRLAETTQSVHNEFTVNRQVDVVNVNKFGKQAALTNMVEDLIRDATQCNATDIHIEYNQSRLSVIFRSSHHVLQRMELPVDIGPMVGQKLVMMGSGDISEKYIPQDLSFSFDYNKTVINIRMSILYTITGYSIVLRLLQSDTSLLLVEDIVNDKLTLDRLQSFLSSQHGMLLVTGPTASGKSTLLYSALDNLAKQGRKILTIEDPVEIKFSALNQVQLKLEVGLGFTDVIKSSLRQNPDVLMVGEIRDSESAEICMRAGMTGVLVLSTLHTPTTSKTLARLLDLGVDPFLVACSLKTIISARLFWSICEKCKTSYELTAADKKILEYYDKGNIVDLEASFYQGKGCKYCNETGNLGMTLVTESITLTEELTDLIVRKETAAFLSLAQDMVKGHSLLDQAYQLVLSGRSPVSDFLSLVVDL